MAETQQEAQDKFLTDLPEGWKPEPGDKVVGKVVGLQKGWSDYTDSYYPIVVIHDEVTDEPMTVHGFHFVLKDRLASLRPRLGERIGIKMGDKIPSKDGKRSIQTYTVKIDGRTEDIWDDIKNPRTAAAAAQTNAPATAIESDDDIPF